MSIVGHGLQRRAWRQCSTPRVRAARLMDFLEIIRMLAALLVTVGLILLASWAMRRFGPDAMSRLQVSRKERRLTLVETLVLDPARRLVLVRLDDEERLILLGAAAPSQAAGDRRLMRAALTRLWKAVTGVNREDLRRAALLSFGVTVATMILPAVALAQAVNIDLGTGAGLTE
eukprot:gene59160-81008_t